jgi:hypothetical protein
MKMKMKLWIVQREILATTVQGAIKGSGRVIGISEAAKEYQPEEKKKSIGFKK